MFQTLVRDMFLSSVRCVGLKPNTPSIPQKMSQLSMGDPLSGDFVHTWWLLSLFSMFEYGKLGGHVILHAWKLIDLIINSVNFVQLR
jgi:hypothetical protein